MSTSYIDTKEAERRDFIFCSEYGCKYVVPDEVTADLQGWSRDQYFYKGRRRRCPGPHAYAYELSGPEEAAMKFGERFLPIFKGIADALNQLAEVITKGARR